MLEIIRQIPGPVFLIIYASLATLLIIAVRVILIYDETKSLEVPEPTTINSLEMAYLVSGIKGAISFSVYNLWKNEMISIRKVRSGIELRKTITISNQVNNPLESIIIDKMEKPILYQQLFTDRALKVLDNIMNRSSQRLEELYLLPNWELIRKRRFVVFITLGLLLFIGSVKLTLGLYHHKPVGYLIVLMVLIAILNFSLLYPFINQPTALGRKFIKNASKRFEWIKKQDISDQSWNDHMAYGVAIFGAFAILNNPVGRLLDTPAITSDFTSGSGCGGSGCGGSGCGGSGCGGGGCGGCGGS